MKNQRIITAILATLILVTNSTVSASATNETDPVVYTNQKGVELTEQEYNNLNDVFDNDTIDILDKKIIDLYKDSENNISTENEKYIKCETYYGPQGIVGETETEVTKNEYELSDALPEVNRATYSYSAYSGKTTHETTYKKINIKIDVSGISGSYRTVTLTNT